MLARRVRLCAEEDIDPFLSQADRVGRMLNGLHRSLENSHN